MSFRPGVDSQFSHGSDMATECFKMSEVTQKHSPLFIFQVENLFCTLCLQIKECTAYTSLFFRWIVAPAWILLSAYLLEIARLICEKNLAHTEFKNTSFSSSNESEETFDFFVCVWNFGHDPLFLSDALNIIRLMKWLFVQQKIWLI